LQDLRRSLYVKAKAEPTWRFWGLYVHVCKMETLHEAYQAAKKNDGAPGIDGVTFDAIATSISALTLTTFSTRCCWSTSSHVRISTEPLLILNELKKR
jgi:hypothetical protein